MHLDNLDFIVADQCEVALGPRSPALSVHTCNEANRDMLDRCRTAGCSYGIMSCCNLECLCDEWMRVKHLTDHKRYALMCGMNAERYGARSVLSIDSHITNRHSFSATTAPIRD